MLESVVKWMIASATVFIVCIYYFEWNMDDCDAWMKQKARSKNSSWLQPDDTVANSTKLPLLLLWTAFHGRRNDLGFLTKKLDKCKAKCEVTNDKQRLNESAVILFHGCDMDRNDLPITQPWQVKLFFMRESPGRGNHFYKDWSRIQMSYFNSTCTYRSDADYYFPYITLRPLGADRTLPVVSEQELDDAIKKKTSGSFSLISHCETPSSRERIIRRLENMTEVNTYGKCGAHKCDKDCEEKLIESHYFYLGMENSICDQYITEKLGRFKKLIVPITINRSIVPAFIPPDSFIALDDFCSLQELTEHMEYLMRNATAYKSYFTWTKKYSPVDDEPGICRICEDAHARRLKTRDYSKYSTISNYFSPKQCLNSAGKVMMQNRCDLKKTTPL